MQSSTPSKPTPPPARKNPADRRARPQFELPPTPVIVVGAILLALVVMVGFAVYRTIDERNKAIQPIEGLEVFPNLSGGHTVEAVAYQQLPPPGGQHNPQWQNCGVYDQPIPDEYAVHSLEHGAVWITYLPNLATDQIQTLQALARQTGYRLLSPYPDQSSPIVVTAWGYQLKLESANDERLLQFIRRYEQNPLGPEPGAACTGGSGRPK